MSSLSQHSELAGRVVSHVYCGTESFLKETENKKQERFRSLSCLPHKGLGSGLSLSTQFALYCQTALISWGSVCSLLQFCSLQNTCAANAARKRHTHTNTPPISIYQANLLCSSRNKTSLARLEEEGRFCIHPDMLRNAHLFLPAAALLLWSTNTAYGKPYRKAEFWSFTAQCHHLLWRFVNERDQEACWLSSLKVTAGYISISLNLSYRLGTPLQPVLLQPSNEIMN